MVCQHQAHTHLPRCDKMCFQSQAVLTNRSTGLALRSCNFMEQSMCKVKELRRSVSVTALTCTEKDHPEHAQVPTTYKEDPLPHIVPSEIFMPTTKTHLAAGPRTSMDSHSESIQQEQVSCQFWSGRNPTMWGLGFRVWGFPNIRGTIWGPQ